MAQSAVVRDYRALEIGRQRANRLVLTVTGMRSPDIRESIFKAVAYFGTRIAARAGLVLPLARSATCAKI